jgi:hypothetical protein
MKRLIRQNNADRLQNIGLNESLSMQLIKSKDPNFDEDDIQYFGNSKAAYGAISDNGRYVVEAYIYETNTNDFKSAYVIDQLDEDGNPIGEPQVIIQQISSANQADLDLTDDGISLPRGGHITFYNEFTSYQDFQQLEQDHSDLSK